MTCTLVDCAGGGGRAVAGLLTTCIVAFFSSLPGWFTGWFNGSFVLSGVCGNIVGPIYKNII